MDRDIEKNGVFDSSPTAPAVPEKRNDLVDFDGPDDPGNPRNWTARKRIAVTTSMGLMTFVVTFSSSIWSVCITVVAEEFHIGYVTSTLGVALFLLVRSPTSGSKYH